MSSRFNLRRASTLGFRRVLGGLALFALLLPLLAACGTDATATIVPTVAVPTDTAMMAAPTDTAMMAAPTDTAMMAAPTDTAMMAAPTDTAMMAAPTDTTMMATATTGMMATGTTTSGTAMPMGTGTAGAAMTPFPTVAVPTVTPVTPAAGSMGSVDNPIRMAFVPSSNTTAILASAQPLADQLTQITGYHFEVSVPTSYAAVIEAVGSQKVDVAWLSPFAYVLANQKYGAQVLMCTVRQGSLSYPSVFITADPSVQTVADLKGKSFAFVDPSSASGYLYPYAYLKNQGYDPNSYFSQVVFAGGHDKVVSAVYNGQVSGGAVYGGAPNATTGAPTDARTTLLKTNPDVLDKVRIIGQSQPIPNDTVSVGSHVPADVAKQVENGLLVLATTTQGKQSLSALYQIDGLYPVQDSFYDSIRQVAEAAGISDQLESLFPTPKPAAAGTGTPGAAVTGTPMLTGTAMPMGTGTPMMMASPSTTP